MSKNAASALLGVLTLLALAMTAGCSAEWVGPSLGVFNYPVPISPWLQTRMEDNYIWQERYARMPILGPITPGAPTAALDPPSEDEVMRTLERARPVSGNWPMLYEIQRNNVRIVVEPILDHIDPQPRNVPLVGPCQLHTATYKCIVYFTEVTRVGWPLPYTTVDEDCQEVVYIDHSHLHMVGNVDPGLGTGYPSTGVQR